MDAHPAPTAADPTPDDGPVLIGSGAALPEMMARRVEVLTAALVDRHGATDGTGRFLAAQAATAMARLEILPDVEADARRDLAERAAFAWEIDRAADAARLGARLHRHPDRIALQLRRTPYGCDWLMVRLAVLVTTIAESGAATPEQLARIADLLGIAPDLRDLDERIHPDTPLVERVSMLRDDLVSLRNARTRAATLDEADRRALISGLGYERSAAGRRLFAYEQSCMKRYHWATAQLEHLYPDAPRTPAPSPASSDPTPADPPPPEPSAPSPTAASPTPAAPAPSPAPTSSPTPAAPRNRRERRLLEAAARRADKDRRRAASSC